MPYTPTPADHANDAAIDAMRAQQREAQRQQLVSADNASRAEMALANRMTYAQQVRP